MPNLHFSQHEDLQQVILEAVRQQVTDPENGNFVRRLDKEGVFLDGYIDFAELARAIIEAGTE